MIAGGLGAEKMVMRFFVKPFFASSGSRLSMSDLEKMELDDGTMEKFTCILLCWRGSCSNYFFFYASVFHFGNANYLAGVHSNYS